MEMLVPRGHANETLSESQVRRWNVRSVPDNRAAEMKKNREHK